MKVVLTESQVKLIQEQQLVETLCESLNESVNFQQIVQKCKQALVAGIAVSTIVIAINKMNISDQEKEVLKDMVENTTTQNDSLRTKQIEAMKSCMQHYLGLQGRSLENCKISPEQLVDKCNQYGFDKSLAAAMAQCESNFGFGNRAQRTNSPWSVGSFDNGSNIYYSDMNSSIEPYIKLIKNDYLIDGKTVDDLLQNGQFVNFDGKRYAKDPKYEAKVRATRNAIRSKWPDLG